MNGGFKGSCSLPGYILSALRNDLANIEFGARHFCLCQPTTASGTLSVEAK